MPSQREQVPVAPFTRLETALSATVQRNKALPERVPERHSRRSRSGLAPARASAIAHSGT